MSEAPQIIGSRFNRLVVVSRNGRGKHVCRCDCGGRGDYWLGDLRSGRVKSCGCYNREKKRGVGEEVAWAARLRYLRSAARARGIPYELTDEQARALCSSRCHYCDAKPSKWEGAKKDYLASAKCKGTRVADKEFAESKVIFVNGIDRLDSLGSYCVTNVVPCCTACNLAKLNRSVADFKEWVARVYRHFVAEL